VWTTPLLYERLRWPEVRLAATEDCVCLVPVVEDHGRHMQSDTDLRITADICRRAGETAPDIVLFPAARLVGIEHDTVPAAAGCHTSGEDSAELFARQLPGRREPQETLP